MPSHFFQRVRKIFSKWSRSVWPSCSASSRRSSANIRPSTRLTSSEQPARSSPRSKVSNYSPAFIGACRHRGRHTRMLFTYMGMTSHCCVTGSVCGSTSDLWDLRGKYLAGIFFLLCAWLQLARRFVSGRSSCYSFNKRSLSWSNTNTSEENRKVTSSSDGKHDALKGLHFPRTQESPRWRLLHCNLRRIFQRHRKLFGRTHVSHAYFYYCLIAVRCVVVWEFTCPEEVFRNSSGVQWVVFWQCLECMKGNRRRIVSSVIIRCLALLWPTLVTYCSFNHTIEMKQLPTGIAEGCTHLSSSTNRLDLLDIWRPWKIKAVDTVVA